jgi:hypothetical protein
VKIKKREEYLVALGELSRLLKPPVKSKRRKELWEAILSYEARLYPLPIDAKL